MSAGPVIIRVKWKSRTAGFESTDIEEIVQKACVHFRLLSHDHDYILLGNVHGTELELTDDMLKYLPNMATVTLSRVPRVCDSDEDTPSLDLEMSNQSVHAPPLNASRSAGMNIIRRTGSRRTQSSAQRAPSMQVSVGSAKGYRHMPGVGSIPLSWRKRESVAPYAGGMTVNIKLTDGQTLTVPTESNETIEDLKDRIESLFDISSHYQRLIFRGQQLEDGRTLSDYNILRNSTLDLVERLRGGKPVIYLFPPQPLPSATVSVHLVPQWSFSHVYPLAQTKFLESGKETITWSVSADVDGTLVEETTGLELSYLFWEALSNGDTTPPSPPLSPGREVRDEVEHFDPSCPSLEPHSPTAVLLPFTELLPYIDGVLKSLSLHTSARNDFITYWLPALSKKPYVALRFLPQAAYKRAAQLEVTPAPDVVTRVFMLFRGIPSDDAESADWQPARGRAAKVDWPKVVGVQAEAWQHNCFRVLEWGAMEVL